MGNPFKLNGGIHVKCIQNHLKTNGRPIQNHSKSMGIPFKNNRELFQKTWETHSKSMGDPCKINRGLIQKTWEVHSKSTGNQCTWEVHWESIHSLFRIHSKSVGNPKSMGNPLKAHKMFIQTQFEIGGDSPLKVSGYTDKINWKCIQKAMGKSTPSTFGIHWKSIQHPIRTHSKCMENPFQANGEFIQNLRGSN